MAGGRSSEPIDGRLLVRGNRIHDNGGDGVQSRAAKAAARWSSMSARITS
jgi:hypothetical protein